MDPTPRAGARIGDPDFFIEVRVPRLRAGVRLDLAVALEFGLSRRAARDAVRSGRVELAGKAADEPGVDVSDDTPVAYFPNRPARHTRADAALRPLRRRRRPDRRQAGRPALRADRRAGERHAARARARLPPASLPAPAVRGQSCTGSTGHVGRRSSSRATAKSCTPFRRSSGPTTSSASTWRSSRATRPRRGRSTPISSETRDSAGAESPGAGEQGRRAVTRYRVVERLRRRVARLGDARDRAHAPDPRPLHRGGAPGRR